jgi:hypothetical protein
MESAPRTRRLAGLNVPNEGSAANDMRVHAGNYGALAREPTDAEGEWRRRFYRTAPPSWLTALQKPQRHGIGAFHTA